MQATQIGGTRAVLCPAEGPPLGSEQDALDLLTAAYEHNAGLVVVPVARLAPGFLTLANGMLGAFVQKLATYRCRIAFVGDIAAELAASRALGAFVRESNEGRDVLFVATREELELRL